jgi:hypothetical protein
MNRVSQRRRGYAFYVPVPDRAGVGLRDAYGSVYMTQKDGSIRKIEDKKHCTKNKL